MMQQNSHREPAILRRPQVQQRTGLLRRTLYQNIKDGEFQPCPTTHESEGGSVFPK